MRRYRPGIDDRPLSKLELAYDAGLVVIAIALLTVAVVWGR